MKIKDILKNNINNEQKLALEQVLNLSSPELIVNKDRELTKKEYQRYQRINKKIKKGIPIQYILKKANFYGNDFYVNKNVLIPRPETELLVQETQKLIEKKFKKDNIDILDIGTGSGVIAITLKLLNKNYNVTATDISRKALKVAIGNSKNYRLKINFYRTNLYKNIEDRFDVVISNPPYIDINSQNVEPKVKNNEPHLALFAKENGLYYYDEILKSIRKILKTSYIIAFEIGENQSKEIVKMVKKCLPKAKTVIKKDLNGFDRYIFITE